jgi:hypothetical protein
MGNAGGAADFQDGEPGRHQDLPAVRIGEAHGAAAAGVRQSCHARQKHATHAGDESPEQHAVDVREPCTRVGVWGVRRPHDLGHPIGLPGQGSDLATGVGKPQQG